MGDEDWATPVFDSAQTGQAESSKAHRLKGVSADPLCQAAFEGNLDALRGVLAATRQDTPQPGYIEVSGELVGLAIVENNLLQLMRLAEAKMRIAYIGSPANLTDASVKKTIADLLSKLTQSAQVYVGPPNAELQAAVQGVQSQDMMEAADDMFDSIIITPGGPGAEKEAKRFNARSKRYIFRNSASENGSPKWFSEVHAMMAFDLKDLNVGQTEQVILGNMKKDEERAKSQIFPANALQYAAFSNQDQAIRLLLNAGMDKDSEGTLHKAPIAIAGCHRLDLNGDLFCTGCEAQHILEEEAPLCSNAAKAALFRAASRKTRELS